MDTENESLIPDDEVTDEMINAGIRAFYLAVDPYDSFDGLSDVVSAVYTAMVSVRPDQAREQMEKCRQVAANC